MARYYVQVSKCASERSCRAAKKRVEDVARIVEWAFGTASDPKAAWFEIVHKATTIADLRSAFGDLSSRIQRIVEIAPGEGVVQSKQLELFKG